MTMPTPPAAPAPAPTPTTATINTATGEAPVTSQAVEVTPASQPPAPEAPKAPDLSTKFAALAKKEKMIRQQEQQIKEERDRYQAWEKARTEAKTNPIAFLESAGLSYKEITDYLLNDSKPSPESQIKALQEQMERDRLERQKEAESKQQQDVQRAIDYHKQQITQFVDSKADDYEFIRANGAYETVFDTIEHYYTETGQLLSIEQAAQHVEQELESEFKKYMSLKKFSKFQQQTPPAEPEVPQTPPTAAPPQSPRTLTNQMVAGATPPKQTEWLSEEESKRRAAAMLRWK